MRNQSGCGELDFLKIHAAYRSKMQRYLARLVGASEAEDLTQEVFVRVSRALPTFRGESQLSTWLYRIATNAATDKMRLGSFHRDAQSHDIEDPDIWTDEAMPSLDMQVLRRERDECFQNFVDALPPDYREVFVLSELQELANSEIAETLGVSLDAVKIRLHRARAKLFQELRAHCKIEDWI